MFMLQCFGIPVTWLTLLHLLISLRLTKVVQRIQEKVNNVLIRLII